MKLVSLAAAIHACLGCVLIQACVAEEPDNFLIIAHRGASGYLAEHTLASKALAYGMGADFIEQDVVLARDGRAVVLHDIHLDTVTDVADRFPDRARSDGRFYAADFDWPELRTLNVHERVSHEHGRAVYPGRFPSSSMLFRLHTLEEELELIQGLNKSTGKSVGVYVEIKKPAWHRGQGMDISQSVLAVLERYGYHDKSSPAFLQCFDPSELRRVRQELGCRLRLVQLIGDNSWQESSADYDQLRRLAGLQEIAAYADGIGPRLADVVQFEHQSARPTPLSDQAHELGLFVHPFTARADALPKGCASYAQLMEALRDAQVDGVFTDFPDR